MRDSWFIDEDDSKLLGMRRERWVGERLEDNLTFRLVRYEQLVPTAKARSALAFTAGQEGRLPMQLVTLAASLAMALTGLGPAAVRAGQEVRRHRHGRRRSVRRARQGRDVPEGPTRRAHVRRRARGRGVALPGPAARPRVLQSALHPT